MSGEETNLPVEKIHHIGIAVPELDASIEFYTHGLGLALIKEVTWSELGLRAALFKIGEVIIELIQPIAASGKIAQDLARTVQENGWGIHHIAIEVEDLPAILKDLVDSKVPLIDEIPRTVAGGRIAWLRSEAAPGGMIELVEHGYEIR